MGLELRVTSDTLAVNRYYLNEERVAMPSSPQVIATRASLADLVRYFLYLGTLGFGGPVALVGFMHRDLVEQRRWVDEEEYRLALALAQIMPGPLAAQLAIALGYFQRGILGATAVGLAFVVPSFLMVVAISIAYVRFGGLWWMQALFYGIGAAVIAIIAIAAYKLARSTNKRDPLLWGDLRRAGAGHCLDAGRAGGVLRPGRIPDTLRSRPDEPTPGRRLRAGRSAGPRHHLVDRALVREPDARWGARAAPDPRLLHQGRRLRLRQRAGDRAVPAAGRRPAVRLAERAASSSMPSLSR